MPAPYLGDLVYLPQLVKQTTGLLLVHLAANVRRNQSELYQQPAHP